jgi:hypothetical protein
LINGDMRIDQRNAGAVFSSISSGGTYTLDRWQAYSSPVNKFTVQQDAGAVTPPAGFNDYLGVTSTSAYSSTTNDYFGIDQIIEGFNIADFGYGTANAQTVTLSFWVRSSLTGTFSGALRNGGANDYSYVFTYTISAANTWEQKTLTITGVTAGTWLTTNGQGLWVWFDLGTGTGQQTATVNAWQNANNLRATGSQSIVGTNGATFYITGVQLEKGTAATNFDFRSIGTELGLCQRYFYLIAKGTDTGLIGSASYFSATRADGVLFIPTSMRSVPTFSLTTGASYYRVYLAGSSYTTPSISLNGYTANYSGVYFYNNTNLSGLSNGSGWWESMNASAFIALTAEL